MRCWITLAAVLAMIGCGDDTAPTEKFVSMMVTPGTSIVAVGKSRRLLAQLVDDKGFQFDVSQTATWSSSNPSVATATTGGLVAGVAAGMTAVSAAREGQTGMAMVMVIPHDITKIDVTPRMAVLPRGGMQQLTAIATLTDMTMIDVTQTATWTSNNLAAVTVNKGLLTGVSFGQATVNASSEAIVSAAVQVIVGNPPDAGPDGPEPGDAGTD
ncbi:MAG TPA: Ig-like domain-containing protein [Polyangia bacterium]|nr:Ig-like domain-containing protein [Polyangia bacterium]